MFVLEQIEKWDTADLKLITTRDNLSESIQYCERNFDFEILSIFEACAVYKVHDQERVNNHQRSISLCMDASITCLIMNLSFNKHWPNLTPKNFHSSEIQKQMTKNLVSLDVMNFPLSSYSNLLYRQQHKCTHKHTHNHKNTEAPKTKFVILQIGLKKHTQHTQMKLSKISNFYLFLVSAKRLVACIVTAVSASSFLLIRFFVCHCRS